MSQRSNQYGESLVGPPTYAEWLSKELGELLLREGAYTGDATNLYIETDNFSVRLNDYWNFCHKDHSGSANMSADYAFYEAGHTPILNIAVKFEGSKAEYALFRPVDSHQGGLGYILTRGYTEKQLHTTNVVVSMEVNGQGTRSFLRSYNELRDLTNIYNLLSEHFRQNTNR